MPLAPPRLQRRLRNACLAGDLEALQQLLDDQHATHTWLMAWLHWLSNAGARPALLDLDYAYYDDTGAHPSFYLAAGSWMMYRALQDHANPQALLLASEAGPSGGDGGPAHPTCCLLSWTTYTSMAAAAVWALGLDGSAAPWLARTPGRPVARGPAPRSAQRARVLGRLLALGHMPDLSRVTDRAEGLLHLAVLNGGSPQVLELLLFQLPPAYPPQLRPQLQLEDADGHTGLDLALLSGGFVCMAMLLAAGALQGNRALSEARVPLASQLQPRPAGGGSRSILQPQLWSVLSSAFSVAKRLPFVAKWASQVGILWGGETAGDAYDRDKGRQQIEMDVSQALTQAKARAGATAAGSGGASGSGSGGGASGSRAGSGAGGGTGSLSDVSDAAAVMSLEGAAEALQGAVDQVGFILNVDPATALSLLQKQRFDVERVLEGQFQVQLAQPAATTTVTATADVAELMSSTWNGGAGDDGRGTGAGGGIAGGDLDASDNGLTVVAHSPAQGPAAGSSRTSTTPPGATAATASPGQQQQPQWQQRTCLVCYESSTPPAAPPDSTSAPTPPATSSWWRLLSPSAATAPTAATVAGATFSVDLPCQHDTCDACWLGILRARVDEGQPQRTTCPIPGCGLILPLDKAQALLPPREFAHYRELLAQHYVDAHPHTRWCPRPGCGRLVRLQLPAPGGADPGRLAVALVSGHGVAVRCDCGQRFCWSCAGKGGQGGGGEGAGGGPHEPASCEQAASWRRLVAEMGNRAEEDTSSWLVGHTKACPNKACGARIEKEGGCNHMQCRQCGHEFCWVCMGDWEPHSLNAGGAGSWNCNRYVPATAAAAGAGAASAATAGKAPITAASLLLSFFDSLQSSAQQHKYRHYSTRVEAYQRGEGGGGLPAVLRHARVLLDLTLGAATRLHAAHPPGPTHPPAASGGGAGVQYDAGLLMPERDGLRLPQLVGCPPPPPAAFWASLQDAVESGCEVLSQSYVMGYYMSDTASRR